MGKRASAQARPTESERSRLQSRWQAVLDTVQDAVISIDAGGHVTLFNRAAERIFGFSSDEVVGHKVNMLMPSPYSEEHDGYLEAYRRTGSRKAIGRIRDVHARRKSGEIFPIELSVSEAVFEDENVYMAIIRDVSERLRQAEALGATEAALDESEAKSRAIIDNAVDGIITIDDRSLIDSFNPAASRMFGYTAAEVIGRNVALLMPEPYRHEHDGYVQEYLRSGRRKIIGIGREVTGRRKDGSIFPVYLSVSEVRVGDRQLFTGLVQDLTERRRAEARLREMEKTALERQRLADIGAITSQIVHDLGNPLAGISMQAQLIMRRARRDPNQPLATVAAPAEQIVARIKHLDALVHDFLEFAREQRLKIAPLDLGRFLGEVIEFWRPVAAIQDIALDYSDPPTSIVIAADEEKLRRVFDNLIKNALEAIDAGPGTISLGLDASHPTHVRILVSDTGPGLPQDLDIFRLFETTKPLGTGLGLPIARQIISAHGGGIEVANAQPHGAVFQVDLPHRGPVG